MIKESHQMRFYIRCTVAIEEYLERQIIIALNLCSLTLNCSLTQTEKI